MISALVFSVSAAFCSAMSNLFFRRNGNFSSQNLNPSAYLMLFYGFSFLLSILFYPAIWTTKINFIMIGVGICVGLLSSFLMLLTARAIKKGPSGLTFAFHNASAIFPGVLLFVIFGSSFGFSLTLLQVAGMILVLSGLFGGAIKEVVPSSQEKKSTSQVNASLSWLKYAIGCFIVQILALTFIQGRCIFFECSGWLSAAAADDIWFMPAQFGAAFLMQAILFVKENASIGLKEIRHSICGGIANFAATYQLLLATKLALPLEKAILFPCFSVTSMILCNLWANKLYGENFNWLTNIICAIGIFMASVQL